MSHIRVRKINIDVIPDNPNPFVEMVLEKVITSADGDILQVIGNYGRIIKRLSDIPTLDIGTIADDGKIDALEMMGLISTHARLWVITKYGGKIIPGGVEVLDDNSS